MTVRSLYLNYLFSEKIRHAKIVEFGEIICDRILKHIKSFESICCWVRLRSPERKPKKMNRADVERLGFQEHQRVNVKGNTGKMSKSSMDKFVKAQR